MESNLIKYKLIQKNGTYILSASTVENEIKIKLENSNSSYSHTFSVETWKTIGSIFQPINTAVDAIQWIKNAMKVHKVKVVEKGSSINLIFAIIEANKTRHLLIIPISGDNQKASGVGAKYNTASFATSQIAEVQPQTQSIQQTYSQYQSQNEIPQTSITLPTTTTTTTTKTTTTAEYTRLNDKFNYYELGIDPSKVRKSIVNFNNPEMAKSIDAEQKLRLSQVGKVTTELPKTQTVNVVKVQPQERTINYSQYQSQQYIPQQTLTVPSPVSVPVPVPAPVSVPAPKTTIEYTRLNDKFNYNELGIDPSQVKKSIVNFNYPEMVKSIDAEQKLRLSQVGKVTTDNYVPEDKVKIPYQIVEKPVQEGITNTTAVSFNRPYITPADGRTY